MSKRGRPICLDEVNKREVVAIVAAGGTRAMAARYVGCTAASIRAEAKRDPDFAARLAKAPDVGELGCLESIRKAAKDPRQWRAAAWVLERTRPERYAARKPNVLTFAQVRCFIGQLVTIVIDEVPARQRKQILKRLGVLLGSLRASDIPQAR